MSGDAVRRLDEITRRLRRECPWDREQDERSIVPHTVEEAYELADAAESGDDTKLLDELGDVLFQVHFLALLLEERGAGSLDEVAEAMVQKLIRRHPHVFGPGRVASGEHDNPAGSGSEAEDPGGIRVDEVLAQWDRIKREQEGRAAEDPFDDVPENLPALLYARKMQRRAAAAGLGGVASGEQAIPAEADSRRIGDALFALVDEARRLRVDPELALRAASRRFRDEAASGEPRPEDPGPPAN